MFVRTITIQAEPPLQINLHYESRERAEEAGSAEGDYLLYGDDYGQSASVNSHATILADVIVDLEQEFVVQAAMKIMELHGNRKLNDRVEGDIPLKVFLRQQRMKQQQPQMMMPPGAR